MLWAPAMCKALSQAKEKPHLAWELHGWRGYHDILACAPLCPGLTHYYKLVTCVSEILLPFLTLWGAIQVWSARSAPRGSQPQPFPFISPSPFPKLFCLSSFGQEKLRLVLLFLGEFWQIISFLWFSTFPVNQENSNACLVLRRFNERRMWN